MQNLTANSVSELLNTFRSGQRDSNATFQPVVQITECRTVKKGGQERLKLMLSDGSFMITGLVAHDCSEGNVTDLQNFSVIKVTEYIMQELTSNKPGQAKPNPVLVVIRFQVIGNPQQVIGNPKKLGEGGSTENAPPHGEQTASNGSGQFGAMPQGMQPIQQTNMYGNAPQAGYSGAPNGGNPMGQVQQAGFGGAPQASYGTPGAFGQPPQAAPGYGGAPQQPAPGTYAGAPAAQFGQQAQQQHMSGGYGGQQYQNNAGPSTVYGGNQGGGPQAVQPRYDQQRGPIMGNSNSNSILKISDITPYQNNWTIKGRCSVKSDMRRYNKNGRAGCVFNFDLLDDSGEIRCVCFGDVAEAYDQQIQQGKCYTLSKVTAKTMDSNKRKWNQTGHNCEIMLDKSSKLEEAPEDASSAKVPMVNVNPVKISTIEAAEVNSFVDVIAVLDSCNDMGVITRKDGSETQKRSFVLRDDSAKSVEVTLWADKATGIGTDLFDRFRAGQHPVLVVKGVRVGDFNGKNLGTVGTSQILIDAVEVDGVQQMQQWYNTGGATQTTQNLSRSGGKTDRRVTTEMMMDEHLGSDQATWVKITGSLYGVRTSPLTYPACPLERNGRTCNKKLQNNDDGTGEFHCEMCGQNSIPEYRYVLSCHLVDFEGGREHVSAFGDQGESLMKMPAGQAHENFEQGNDDALHPYLIRSVLWKPKVFKLKCAEDTYNEESRIKYTLQAIEEADFDQENQVLISMIEDLSSGGPIKIMQPKAPFSRNSYGTGMNNNAFPSPGMGGGVPGPFGPGGPNTNQLYNPNAGYMTQQQQGYPMQQQQFGMPQQGMPQPGMYQPQMGMGYQQQPQQMQQQQPGNALAFL